MDLSVCLSAGIFLDLCLTMKTNKDAVTLSVFLSLFAESVNFMLATSYIFHLAPIMTQKYFIKVQKCLKTDYSDRVNALSTTA